MTRGSQRRFSFSDSSSTGGHNLPESVRQAMPVTLLPMTVASINDTLPGWLEQRVTRGVALVPGGWEGWAPVDLLAWLHDTLGATATRRWDVQCRAGVFTEAERRAALVFNGSTHDAEHPILVVEVVAESALEARAAYAQRLQVSLEWLGSGQLAPSHAAARRMVLALTVDPGTAEALQEHEFGVVAMTKAGFGAFWREVGG